MLFLPPLLRERQNHRSSPYAITYDAVFRLSRYARETRDETLKVWDLETGRELRTLQGHSFLVFGVAMSPDGRRAVSASGDNTLKVWDLEMGVPVATFTCDASAELRVRLCALPAT
jgi:WD40 repeat protein